MIYILVFLQHIYIYNDFCSEFDCIYIYILWVQIDGKFPSGIHPFT